MITAMNTPGNYAYDVALWKQWEGERQQKIKTHSASTEIDVDNVIQKTLELQNKLISLLR